MKGQFLSIGRVCSALVLLGAGGWSFSASADCPSTPNLPYNFTLSSIAVSRDLPIGSDIPGSINEINISGQCSYSPPHYESPGDPIATCYYGTGAEVSGLPGVYHTGVQGIGIAVTNSDGVRVRGQAPTCAATDVLDRLDSDRRFNFLYRVSFVKTSETVSSGTLVPSQTRYGIGVYTKSGLGTNFNPVISFSGNIIIRTEACSVSSPTINVPLGTHSGTDFAGIGSTVGETAFNVDLNCDATAKVNMRIDGNQDSSGAAGVLALDESSSRASGIGVQVLKGDRGLIDIGSAWLVTESAPAGPYSIPMLARYYKTADSVRAGAANATATFTMIYQ